MTTEQVIATLDKRADDAAHVADLALHDGRPELAYRLGGKVTAYDEAIALLEGTDQVEYSAKQLTLPGFQV